MCTISVYAYYSTQRPIGPGTYPKPKGNFPLHIENFDDRTFIPAINREAWGKLTYVSPLSPEDVKSYELVESNEQEEANVYHKPI